MLENATVTMSLEDYTILNEKMQRLYELEQRLERCITKVDIQMATNDDDYALPERIDITINERLLKDIVYQYIRGKHAWVKNDIESSDDMVHFYTSKQEIE